MQKKCMYIRCNEKIALHDTHAIHALYQEKNQMIEALQPRNRKPSMIQGLELNWMQWVSKLYFKSLFFNAVHSIQIEQGGIITVQEKLSPYYLTDNTSQQQNTALHVRELHKEIHETTQDIRGFQFAVKFLNLFIL